MSISIGFQQKAAQWLHQALSSSGLGSLPSEAEIIDLLEIPKNSQMGDLAFPCFSLAKNLRKAPPQIAKEIISLCEKLDTPPQFSNLTAVGPYINFTINKSSLAAELIPSILNNKFLAPRPSKSERVMIEYSQPNTHKAFHVGHTRNVALGDSLVRLYEWCGYSVIAANYIGDVGAHIAKCLWYLRDYYNGEIPKTHRGEFLGEMYVKATQLLEFEDLTLSPHVGVITSQIESALPHPSEDHWNIVTVRTNDRSYSVVCGGRDYEIGDIVALAPPGIRFQGREVQVTDKGGILSEGMICSEAELGLSENRQKIFVFPKNTPLAMEIAEYFRKPEATAYTKGVVAEIQRREKAVSTLLQQLEKGEPEVYKLWQETKQWSMDDFHAIYNWLDSRFDHYFFESEVSDEGKKIVLDGLEKGRLVRSEGAVGVDLQDYGMPFLLLLKSDGTGLYSTKDLALAEKKFTTFKIDRSIYVVDAGQSLHFQQVFKTLEILGYENAKKCYHLAYGKVESADGKMSSRKGNVILFSELKDRLNEKIMYEFLDKYHGEWPEQEIQEACHRIAVATIKYGMLNQDPNKNIVFDLGEWTARTGNTGPYLLYAYARIQSILREAGPAPAVLNWTQLEHESEHELLRQLLRFQEVVESAAEHYEPNKVCLYLYDLAKQFSRMYADCPVLKAANPELKWARVKLIEAAGMVLQKSLNLIGIKTLDRM